MMGIRGVDGRRTREGDDVPDQIVSYSGIPGWFRHRSSSLFDPQFTPSFMIS